MPLLDDMICARQHRLRNREAESLRSPDVDHKLECDGRLDQEIGQLRTLEDLVDVHCRSGDKSETLGPYDTSPPASALCLVENIDGRRFFVAKSAIRSGSRPFGPHTSRNGSLRLAGIVRQRTSPCQPWQRAAERLESPLWTPVAHDLVVPRGVVR